MKNKSYGEDNIKTILLENNIPFTQQKTFNDCKSESGRRYKFDFFINNSYLLEYDGKQHFEYTGTGWDTKEHFKQTRKSDLAKNKYCFNNNIPLIRIPYNKDYTLYDLLLETSPYILTSENENNYYQMIIQRQE